MDNVIDGITELTDMIKGIQKDVRKAIDRINNTPDDRGSNELNDCINDVDSILHDIYDKLA